MPSFYDAYRQRTAENEGRGLRDLQQVSSLVQLQNAFAQQRETVDQQKRNEALRAAIAALPPEKRTKENVLPLVLQHSSNVKDVIPALKEEPKAIPIGAGGLKNPDGSITPPAARPTPEAAPKAPPQRQRYDGTNVIQEELQADGTWKVIGKGPRFAPEKPERPRQPPTGFRWADPEQTRLEPIPGGPAVTPPQGPKIPGEIQRMNIAMNALDHGLNAYDELLKTFNPRNPIDQFDPQKRAKAQSLVADLRMQAKEAQALGALTGPDMIILDQLLKNPASLSGAYYGIPGLKEQVTQSREAIKRRRAGIAQQYPTTPGGGGGTDNDPLNIRGR